MPMRFCLFGVPGSHLNLGVGALRAATLGMLLDRQPDAEITVFDDGWGIRPGEAYAGERAVPVTLCGARDSRRVHRPEAYLNMRMSALLGGLGNAALARIDAADAVLDVSGGDSFSDIYGMSRFRTVAWPKRIALLRGRPLVLLPQTYGPFEGERARREAASLVRRSTMAWARDPESYAALCELAGTGFDPARHREGVDVAFALTPRRLAEPAEAELLRWWSAAPGPVVGINVSGLMYLPESSARFGLTANGWEVVRALGTRLVKESEARIVIVPHVRGRGGPDDDNDATEALRAALADLDPARVTVAPPGDPHQTKWVIARTDWFCGMRMHATIAALSSGVPASIVAYSKKARGVFATVGQERQVADARQLDDEGLLAALWESWLDRDTARAELAPAAPAARGRAVAELDEIIAVARRSG